MKKIIKKLSILFASLAMVMGVALAKDDTHVVNAAESTSIDIVKSGALGADVSIQGSKASGGSGYTGVYGGGYFKISLSSVEAGSAISFTYDIGTYGAFAASKHTFTVGFYSISGELISTSATFSSAKKNTSAGGDTGNGSITLNAGVTTGELRFTSASTSSSSVYNRVYNIGATYLKGSGETPVDPNVKVETITIVPDTLNLEVGETQSLSIEVLPANAYDKTVTWSTSDETIATIDAEGKVTAVKEGTATITATANDGSNVTASADVTVVAAPFVKFESSEKIDGDLLTINGIDFTISTEATYRGYGTHGAQFGSSGNPAGTVTFITRTTAFDRSNFRLIIGTTFTGDGPGTLKVYLGSTLLGEKSLTKGTDMEYEFTIPASAAAAAVNNSDILKIELTNPAGAVYLKNLKVYSDGISTINPADLFITDWRTLRDASGSICNALNDKTNLDALFARYDALTDAEKATVDAATDVEGVTIKQSMDYLRDVLNGTTKTDGDYGITPTESASNILTEVKDSSTIVILVAVLGVIAISAYYFVEKRKLAK